MALTWRPWSLFSHGILVHGLGARALSIDIEPADSAVALPDNLALPIDIVIERLAVGVLSWRVGTGHGKMEGLEFSYVGGASAHRMTDLRVVTKVGTLTGNATLGAAKPFAVDGSFKLAGDATLRDARINLAAKGTLASLAVDVDGRAGEGFVAGHATLAPLADVPLIALTIDARDVDLAAWDRALPTTRIAASVHAQPADGGLAGTIQATNALAGNFAAGRSPFRTFTTRFAWQADVLALDEIAAELEGGAKATRKGAHRRWAIASPAAAGRSRCATSTCGNSMRHSFRRALADQLSPTSIRNGGPSAAISPTGNFRAVLRLPSRQPSTIARSSFRASTPAWVAAGSPGADASVSTGSAHSRSTPPPRTSTRRASARIRRHRSTAGSPRRAS